MEGYCEVQVQVAEPTEKPQGGCEALLEPYLDQVATEVIAELTERDRDEQDALSRWFGEGGR